MYEGRGDEEGEVGWAAKSDSSYCYSVVSMVTG